MSGTLGGKTPWEFACNWYTPDEIAYSIARNKRGFADNPEVPTDIYSQEFADWLTHQYRLAMRKGIEIGQRTPNPST
jgi:hypothetical protein